MPGSARDSNRKRRAAASFAASRPASSTAADAMSARRLARTSVSKAEVGVERAPCRSQRGERLALVGVIDEQGEEVAIRETLGEDQRQRIDAPALRQRGRDGAALRRDLGGRRGAKSIGDAGAHGLRRGFRETRHRARAARREFGLRRRARRTALPVLQHEARGRAGII